jgi:hypothetical protein
MVTVGELITSVLLPAGVSGFVVWLLRTSIGERLKNAIKHEYDGKLELYRAQLKAATDSEVESLKARLQADNAVAVERLRADLQITASEHQIRFARLHEKVAETLAETYARLYKLSETVAAYVSPYEFAGGPTKRVRREAAGEALRELSDYFRPRRLYLPKPLADRIYEFQGRMFELTRKFMVGVEHGGDDRHPDSGIDTWVEVATAMREEGGPLFDAIEAEFRSLLGVQSGHKLPGN